MPAAASDAAMAQPTPPQPTTSARAGGVETFALDAAHEPGAIEHVAQQAVVGPAQYGVTGSRNLRRRGDLIHQTHGGHLVRHGGQRPANVRELEEIGEDVRKIFNLDPYRHHDRIHAGLLERRVVNHRRLERLGGIADVGDEVVVLRITGCLRFG